MPLTWWSDEDNYWWSWLSEYEYSVKVMTIIIYDNYNDYYHKDNLVMIIMMMKW